MARARRSTASLGGLAVGMGGMGGVSERKEVEQLVRECRDRMGECARFFHLFLKSTRSKADSPFVPVLRSRSLRSFPSQLLNNRRFLPPSFTPHHPPAQRSPTSTDRVRFQRRFDFNFNFNAGLGPGSSSDPSSSSD